MNKMIIINNNSYDLELLSRQSEYFLAMYNFEINDTINLTHRGEPFEIIIKILLDKYIYDEDYIINYNEIIEIRDELMLNNHLKIETIEQMCNCIIAASCEIERINKSIWRYHNNTLTKTQKNSKQYAGLFWKNIHYLDPFLTYEENENIYKQNNSLKKDRYEGILNFDIIKYAYIYRNLLKISKYLIFNTLYFNSDKLLIMENNFDLYLDSYFIELDYWKNNKEYMKFANYINKDKIIKLYLNECKIDSDCFNSKKDIERLIERLIESYITSHLSNLEYIEIKKLRSSYYKGYYEIYSCISNSFLKSNINIKFYPEPDDD